MSNSLIELHYIMFVLSILPQPVLYVKLFYDIIIAEFLCNAPVAPKWGHSPSGSKLARSYSFCYHVLVQKQLFSFEISLHWICQYKCEAIDG